MGCICCGAGSLPKKVEALLDYCRWEWGDKQKLSKFDEIGDQHNEALIAMGVIDKAPESKRGEPELPELDLYWRYRQLKFGRNENVLVPRAQLSFSEIESYCRLSSWAATPTDIDIIMSIDAIFETREAK